MTEFNWLHYKYLNLDISGLNSNRACSQHYKNIGKKQNRNCNIKMAYPDFNHKQYALNYSDLTKYINNQDFLENHWLRLGIRENRSYMQNIETTIDINNYTNNNKYENNNISKIMKTNITDYLNNNLIETYDEQSIDENMVNYTRMNNMTEIIKCTSISLDTFNNINNFILIIDFPNLGGGTTIFLNSIISHYKSNTSFLIARNHNNMVYFYINDDKLLNITYNEQESIQFISNNKHKIDKILINHTLKHNNNFINSLFNLDKHISIITHDLYQITNTPNQFYHKINEDLKNNIILNKFNMIITQNIKNLKIFSPYLNNTQDIVISPLPDFKYPLNIINTNNTNICVCFIGNISDVKGALYIKQLYDFYIHNKNIKFVLFGCICFEVNIEKYKSNIIFQF